MRILTTNEINERLPEIHKIVHAAYPEFINHDQVSKNNWDKLYNIFINYQIVLYDNDQIIAIGNAIPIYINDYNDFTNQGWDWALENGVKQYKQKIAPNNLVGLSVVVNSLFVGNNHSETVLNKFKNLCKDLSLKNVLIPIRPTKKHLYPLTEFEEYSNIKINNEYFDPWIRIHERIGGKRICICKNAMLIVGNITEWETWTGIKFPISGEYHVNGGLVPIKINVERNVGSYSEPNIWYEHKI